MDKGREKGGSRGGREMSCFENGCWRGHSTTGVLARTLSLQNRRTAVVTQAGLRNTNKVID